MGPVGGIYRHIMRGQGDYYIIKNKTKKNTNLSGLYEKRRNILYHKQTRGYKHFNKYVHVVTKFLFHKYTVGYT